MLKKLSLRHYIAILCAVVINTFLLVIACFRTNYEITCKGGLVEARDIIEVNEHKENTGSFSTIYVISFSKSTLFQNFIGQFIPSVSIRELSTNESKFSDFENLKMGEIEHNTSIMQAIICAYTKAQAYNQNIKIDYSLKSLVITYYDINSDFKIGDEIIDINGNKLNNLNLSYGEGYLSLNVGDKITYIRDDETKTIQINKEEKVYCYPYYDIDYDSIYPSLTINRGYTNGPSGGLLRALSLIDDLLDYDLTDGKKIAGTGTISSTGYVGAIGGIKQKIYTAVSNDVDIFFCPSSNYEEALEVYNTLKTDMLLIEVSNIDDALEVLYEI